jgi:hypothetical protein
VVGFLKDQWYYIITCDECLGYFRNIHSARGYKYLLIREVLGADIAGVIMAIICYRPKVIEYEEEDGSSK